jgi:hypothetical protein
MPFPSIGAFGDACRTRDGSLFHPALEGSRRDASRAADTNHRYLAGRHEGVELGPADAERAGRFFSPQQHLGHATLGPAPGAQLEQYDPWDQYRASRAGEVRAEPPYASLVELVGTLAKDPETIIEDQTVRLGRDGEARLAQWCTEHGLIGLLSHQTVLAGMAPRWENLPDGGNHLVMLRRVHRWEAYGWSPTMDVWWRPDHRPVAAAAAPGDLVAADLYAGHWPEPLALMHMVRDDGWATLPLAEAWGPFFPHVPPSERTSYAYPVPESDAFWMIYSEPVGWFLGAASQLRGAVLDLSADPVAADESALDFVYRIDTAARALHTLLSPVQPSLTVGSDGEFRQAWRTRSLLSSFALMALLDLTERRRVLTCTTCGRVFVSGAYQARYCSERCRGTAQKRAYRARARHRNESAHAGSTSETSARTGSPKQRSA